MIREIATHELVSETQRVGNATHVRLVGCADAQTLADVREYFRDLAVGPELVMDVRSLEFVSASCLSVFVRFVAASGVSVTFVTDARRPWQRRTLDGLGVAARVEER